MELRVMNGRMGYGAKAVLKEVNLSLHTGEVTCVLGRNGAGKTTLFKSLLGLLPLLEGSICLDGKDIGGWGRHQFAQAVAYVPQVRGIPFPFTAEEVVVFGRTAYLSPFKSPSKADWRIARESMERTGIAHLSHRIYTELSGGEQQLVIVSRALAQQPAFLVMDEPTSGLDYGNRIQLIDQVKQLSGEGLGVIMATHFPEHAVMCQSRVVMISGGTVWRQDSSEALIRPEILSLLYDIPEEIIMFRKIKIF
ncbi:MAG: ABC transporter ATP-binding protein [Tannerellaceae bacterium]|jgi:iron complex transport system ATP-binding protein|nr:ABC transporter ATP-binding protein [Tannerellaceae bacterium]